MISRPPFPVLLGPLLLALGLAACASTGPAPVAGFSAAGASVAGGRSGRGVIVAIRPAAQAGAGSASPRAYILGAMGGGIAGTAAAREADTAAVEFIIREDAGQTVSVMQINSEGFRPGERVMLLRGASPRIARADAGT